MKTLLHKLLHFAQVICGIAPAAKPIKVLIVDGLTPAQFAELMGPGQSYPNGGTFIDCRKYRCGDPACPICHLANVNNQVLRSYGQWLN